MSPSRPFFADLKQRCNLNPVNLTNPANDLRSAGILNMSDPNYYSLLYQYFNKFDYPVFNPTYSCLAADETTDPRSGNI